MQVGFFQNIVFGKNSIPVSDNSDQMSRANFLLTGNPYNTEYQRERESENYDLYPPGYAFIFGSIMLGLGLNPMEAWIFVKFIFSVMFVNVGFMLGKKIKNENYGILTSLFIALPVSIWFGYGETVNPYIRLVYPNLNGTNMDVMFIFIELLLVYIILFEKIVHRNAYLLLFYLISLGHGFSHVSRYVTLLLSIGSAILIYIFTFILIRKENRDYLSRMNGLLMSYFISIVSIYLFYFHTPLWIDELEKQEAFERLPYFFSDTWIIIILFTLCLSIPIMIRTYIQPHHTTQYRGQFVIHSRISRYYPQIFLVFVFLAAFMISTNPNYIGSGIPGPYYYGSIATEQSIFGLGKYMMALFTLSMFYFGLSYFKDKIIGDKNFIFFGIYIIAMILFIISMPINLQASRMNLYEYYRPLLVAGGVLFFIQYFSNSQLPMKLKDIAIPVFVILIISLNNVLVVFDNITTNPGITEICYYENRIKSSTVMSNIDTSYNVIDKLSVLLDEDEVILSLPDSQSTIGSILPIRQINSRTVAHYISSGDLWSFFENYDAQYFVVVNDDLKPFERRIQDKFRGEFSVEEFDSINYLDLIYMNNLGERIYQYNRGAQE